MVKNTCAFSLFVFILWILFPATSLYAANTISLKVGETIPNLVADSIEGVPISFHPPAGKILLIRFWSPHIGKLDEMAIEAIVLYNRFHNKGLDSICVFTGEAENEMFSFSERWQIPWPQINNQKAGDIRPIDTLGIQDVPMNILVNEKGKILAINIRKEQAHEVIAKQFGVSLEEIPMPNPPIPKQNKANFLQTGIVFNPSQDTDFMNEHEMRIGTQGEGEEVEASKEQTISSIDGDNVRIIPIEKPDQIQVLNNLWMFKDGKLSASGGGARILFTPTIEKGMFTFRAKLDGDWEGIRIVFGFQSPQDPFYVLNLGMMSNNAMFIEKWNSLDERSRKRVTPLEPFEWEFDKWHDVQLDIDSEKQKFKCFFNGDCIITFESDEPLAGQVGIFTTYSAEFEKIQVVTNR